MSTNVLVPKEKLKELDDARLRLHEILEKTGLHNDAEVFAAFMEVTGVMWKIANRAWPEAKDE